MQVSVETTTSIERRMTISVPAEKVTEEVISRLKRTASTVKMNGFRPGKVPFSVVQKQYGPSVRQEVIGELMRNSYVDALTQEKITPVGYPEFEPKNLEEGKDLEFTATFEVYPDIALADLSALSIVRENAEIKDEDVDNMISLLRKQQAEHKPVDRQSADGDTVLVDFAGTIDGEAFDGGQAEGAKITLGSGQMIPGFEEGLIGLSAGDKRDINVTFPEDYQSAELAGKAAVFAVELKEVQEAVLPEINKTLFSNYGVSCETEAEFKIEIKKNMQRELKQATLNKIKSQIVDGLVDIHEFDVPKSLISQEIKQLKEEAVQQYGGEQQFKPTDLPDEIFSAQAEKRVRVGLIFAALVKLNDIKVAPEDVDARIVEMASTYQKPEEVINWYSSQPEQKSQIESSLIEEQVVDLVLKTSKVEEKAVSYDEAIKPPSAPPEVSDESEK